MVHGAAGAEDVDGILKRGMEMRRKGRDADALVEFQRALRLEDSGRTWAQLALAEQALGLWLDANNHLTRALDRGQEAWVNKNRRALESALATIQRHLCQVEVWGNPAGAVVSIDGKKVGQLPNITAWLDPAAVSLEVHAAGFASLAKTLSLPEGGRIREHVDLKRSVTPVATAATAPARRADNLALGLPSRIASDPPPVRGAEIRSGRDSAKEGDADEPKSPADEGSPITHRWWFWTMVGGVVLAAGGTTAWLLTHKNQDLCAGQPSNCSSWVMHD